MPIPLSQLRQSYLDRLNIIIQNQPVDLKAAIPDNPKATGKECYIRVQWSPNKEACDGYQVVISTTNNIQNPDIGIVTIPDPKSNFYDYPTGNIALTINFAVRAYQGFPKRFYSDWTTVVSGTSIALGVGAAGSAAPASPSNVPATTEPPPSGERTGAGGKIGINF